MTTTYRTAGAWGAGSGADLTPAQVDTNFYDKETRLTALEALGLAVGVDHITVSGDQMTIVMTDASTQGPFTLPTAPWTPRGDWQPSTMYSALDVVAYFGSLYLVTTDHTSDTTFDPNATVGTVELYQLILVFPAIGGQTITAATYDTVLADANTYMRFTNASGCLVTIDPAVTYPAWTEMHFRDETGLANGGITITTATPNSINAVTGYNNSSLTSGGTITVKQVAATGAWDIMGLLLPTTV